VRRELETGEEEEFPVCPEEGGGRRPERVK